MLKCENIRIYYMDYVHLQILYSSTFQAHFQIRNTENTKIHKDIQ